MDNIDECEDTAWTNSSNAPAYAIPATFLAMSRRSAWSSALSYLARISSIIDSDHEGDAVPSFCEHIQRRVITVMDLRRRLTIAASTSSNGRSRMALTSGIYFWMNRLKAIPGTQSGICLRKGKNSTHHAPGSAALLLPSLTVSTKRTYGSFNPKTFLP